MDSYQTFLEVFKRAMSTRNFKELSNVCKNGQGFLEIVSLEHREIIVCSIFDKNNGLLYFLNYELLRQNENNRHLIDALKEAFRFLIFFIENFYTAPCFIQYIHEIKNVCELALTVKSKYPVQKAACDTFMKLIELFKDYDFKFVKTVHTFSWTFHKYVLKDRRFLFCVLGKIIKHNESVRSSQKELNHIFEQLYADALEEYDLNSNVSNNFRMYFDALADILDGHVEPPNAIKEKLFCNSYKWIKAISKSNRQGDNQERVKTVMSAIDLLCRHMNLFQNLLYPDCMYWHDILQRLSLKTTTYGICGQRTLKRFYRIIGQILTNKNNDESKILVKFLEHFYKEFEKTNLDLTTLRLIVYGFSQMAAPCKIHMTEFKVRHMYSITTSYALPLCSNEHSHSMRIKSVCCYQEALSEILCHMTDVTVENINVLIKLGIYTIKRFPDLATSDNALAISTLVKTISNLAIVNKNLLQRYLDSIVYDGIAWSCSHTLALDAELQRELNNLKQSPVCYKNYLPLWTELLNAEKYREQEQLAQHVANTMIDVCITLINRLNINVKQRNENIVLSDVALTQSAVNQADFRVFTNLVDLYVDVINMSEPQLFANTVHRFLYEVIRLSYKYPLISGFYKLIRASMKIFAHISEEEEEEKSVESRRMEKLLSNYLWHTLDLIPAFSNELLIACLYLILDTPFAYVKNALPRTLLVFKIAFTVGLGNLELAYTALTSLEIWTTKAQEQKRDEQTNELLREIIVYLEPYLRSTESSVEISQDLIAVTAKKRVKRVNVINTDCTLRNYQRRILLFLGSLDHDLLTSFVHEHASRNTGASWEYKELFKVCKYSLLLSDARLVIHFDRMLLRVIALARDSSDRRTKIAACEVLHSMIAIIIGSTNHDSENRVPTLYSTLCQAVIILGCDSDEVVCGLFRPLALQLMHWWSSSLKSMSLVIDSLFDSLTNDSNPALREFSGMCLAEFTQWSIRQTVTSKVQHEHTIIEKINNLALHPLRRKRIAAAIAFNHLYVILREEDDTVSIYWLEIFYCFIRSLDGCNDPSITNALAHIEKVMKVKAESLKIASSLRRKPDEFDEATLIYALYWLLSQCGVLDEHCRAKCMELYVSVSQHVNSCAQETTQNFVRTYGINRMNNIILKGLELGVNDISIASNMMPLLKALDYYMWLINKELLPTVKLFPANDIDEQPIFFHIRSFASQFWRIIEESSTGKSATAMKSRELEQLQELQCKVLMTILNFMQMLLNVNVNVPESLWDESLSALIIRCILHPQMIGFDMKNIKMTDKLPQVLKTLLNSMRSRYNYALPNIFNKCLLNFIRKIITKFLDLQDIVKNDSCDDLIQHINGLILLKQCDMLDSMMLEMSAFTNADHTITQIFKFLVTECIGELACRDLSMQMIEYLRALMEFQFSLLPATLKTPVIIPDDVRSIIDTLVKFMSNNAPVTSVDCTIITHGEHFLNIFRNVIFKYMLMHVNAITHVFEDMLCDNPSFLLKWIEDMLLFLKWHKRELQAHVDTMIDAILQQFTCLKNIVFNVDSRKERLMNIYSIVVHLKSKPTEITQNHEFYQWIRDELTNNNNLEYKTKILKNFFVCLTDRDDLQISLQHLRVDSRFLCSNLSETSVSAMKVIDCFETLLILLSTTRSKAMLKCVINFAAGTGNRLFDEKLEEHLRGYYYGASLEHVLESLQETYQAFMKTSITETERLDILHGFLLPAFKFCDSTAIERFFEKNYNDLYINYTIPNDDDAIKQKIVTNIGYFQLITIMFARIDKNKIEINKTITQRSSIDQILINKNHCIELYQRTINIRSFKQPACQELVRLLQCSAYNCLLAIVSLLEEEKSYKKAFENSQPLWENIIDCSRQYKLDQTFKEFPKTRKITVNIRSTEVEEERQMDRYAYVHSYDLSTCTLSEDINAYDLNKCVVLPTINSADSNSLRTCSATSIALVSNDFNEHECMPYICVLLRHIRKVFVLTDTEPTWLTRFLEFMQRDQLCANIQLFMLKIISNTADEVFKLHAKFALTKIIKTITNYLLQNNLNYIITDVLEILMDWHDVTIPNDEDSKEEAQRLFEKFIQKVFIKKFDDNDRVYNYNLSLLRTIVEKWRSCLRVPNELLNQQITSAPAAAVYLILIFLNNNMTEEIIARDDIANFLLKQLKNWNTDSDKTPLQCCECLGLYLRSLDNGKHDEIKRENKKHEIRKKISDILGYSSLSSSHMDKQVKRVAVLCQTYPEVAQDYMQVAISAMNATKYPAKCLEIFALAMPRLSAEDVVTNLHYIGLQKILETRVRDSFCVKIALRIVRDMVAILPMNLLPYKQVIPYIKDNITEHRELVYDIFMKIHKRCSADITVDDNVIVQNLLSVSVQNLLTGLLDPSPDLQDKILKFWTEETNLNTEKLKDRLISLLDMHSPQLITEEDTFAPFVALLMLQQATKSIYYTEKIFDEPLYNSSFEEYKIAVSWRRRNLSCVTPMFVDSLASQMSYSIFSQSVDNDLSGTYMAPTFSCPRLLRLRATQDLQFEPTLNENAADADTTLDISSYGTGFDRTIIASSSRQSLQTTGHERFTRILANTSNTNVFRDAQIQKNMQLAERIKQENIRQRSSVKLYRNYRIGDFPDIEISHESFIVPLQQLVKLDRLICKDVIVSLLCSLIKESTKQSDNFRQIIVERLKRILHDSCERDSSFNAVILETLLKLSQDATTVANCDPRDVVKASKANHLNTLGILLLERSLLPDAREDDSSPTSSKRMRMHDDTIRNEETNKWVQLASLYKSLNDVDVVLSIFRKQQFFGQDVQEAALAEVNGDWIRAKDAFTKAYEGTADPSIKEHCLQGLFEAVNNLCDWSAIDRLVKNRVRNGNLSSIWNDTWRDWIIPYACDAYVYMSEEGDWAPSDMEAIQSWIYNQEKLQHLMPVTGENLVIFLLNKDVRKATDLLNDLLDMTGKQWIGLNPLCTELRIRKLFKLQIMNDLDASLKILRCTNKAEYLNRTVALLNLWSMKAITIRDNLIQWNKLVAYRAYSSMLFQKGCKKEEITKRRYQIHYQLRLGIINAALNQTQRYIAKKHLNYISEVVCEEIHHLELIWLKARIKSLFADVETDISKKMSSYTASWKSSHKLLNNNDELDANTSNAIREHIGTMASKIEFLSKENMEFAIALKYNTTILQNTGIKAVSGIPVDDLDNIQKHLLLYSLNKLRSCCENTIAANVGKYYCALAKYCYNRLMSTDVESDEIFQEFLLSTLKSMYYDCLEATHYFPCLLKPERLQNDKTREIFVQECAKLRPWLFLRWQDLLFSHLKTPSISTAIVLIIERLAEAYPDAIIYNYYLTIEKNSNILKDVNIQRIRSLLHDKAEEYERFLQAIQYVVEPKLYLKYYLDKYLSRENTTAITTESLQKVYPNSSTDAIKEKNPRPGAIFKEIASYESDIKSLNFEAVQKKITQKLEEAKLQKTKFQRNTSELKNYSPFLHEYVGGCIEIPGQYTGDREPMPRYHVRIARFEPQVEVIQSLRKPIRISMIGDNGKEYKFLVKFGEDLTIDRGLHQLYSTMNRTLRNDPDCRQRRLAIDTYEVIPLSSSFGLIQWIEDTRSLDELINFALSDKEKDCCKSIVNKYANWIREAASNCIITDHKNKPNKLNIIAYKKALFKYSQQAVIENMTSLISETRQTALRDAFNLISPSPECFIMLRRNFVTSYATMCVAHWLAGIGDRHLQNTLVHVATGRCLGIDFGHAFGSGIRLQIPELVPFRLTPQILELLRPFTERDLLATIMTHTIRALRDDQGPILACMDIFVHKPVQRSNIDNEIMRNNDEDIDADLTWSPKKNIEIVAKKLNGIHPSIITLKQLKEVILEDRYFTRYDAIVSGNDEIKQARAEYIKKDRLTSVEQVDCLLDQAKDLNILGRMYERWKSWL